LLRVSIKAMQKNHVKISAVVWGFIECYFTDFSLGL